MKQINKNSYQGFLAVFIFLFFATPCLLAGFNFRMDPNSRYHFSVGDELLKQLADSQDTLLTLPSNSDDRALLKKYIKLTRTQQRDFLVLGGSRVLNIQPNMLSDTYKSSFLNAGVTAGTIRDYIALWQLIKDYGLHPKIVLIGIEEQSLNSISQNNHYLSILEYYEAFFSKGISLRIKLMGLTTDLKDLLSLSSTISSIKMALHPKSSFVRPHLLSMKNFDYSVYARTPAFSVLYPHAYEHRALDTVNAEGEANGRGEQKVFEMWNQKDARGNDQLRALLRDIKKSGAVPVLVGFPYHPEANRVIAQSARAQINLNVFVDALSRLAVDEGVYFYDAIFQHRDLLSPIDFIDGAHLGQSATYKLLTAVSSDSKLELAATKWTAES